MARQDAPLSSLVADLRMFPKHMVNVPLEPGVDWRSHAGLSAARESVESMLGDRGRVLIRASGTEPKLRLMVEAEDEALARRGVETLVAVDLTNR